MTALLTLHYAPDNASLVVRLVLEELGVAYDTCLVDRAKLDQRSAAFLALNPMGKIPALETPDGAIFETGAIVLWLADKYGALAPAPSATERGAFLKWLFFLSNNLHVRLQTLFYPTQYVGTDPAAQHALIDQSRTSIASGLDLLNAQAAGSHSWLNASSPSVIDFYLVAMLRWLALYPDGQTDWFDLTQWPNLLELAKRIDARACTKALCAAEGMQPAPFSQPTPPNPPEGSAL